MVKIAVSDIERVRRLRVLSSLFTVSCVAMSRLEVPQDCWCRKCDGGWSDVEESMWAIAVLDFLNGWDRFATEYRKESILWLLSQKSPDGAWGRTSRDVGRIPVTGMLLTVLPELADHRALSWLSDEWEKDLASPVQLTYKGGFYLSALSRCHLGKDDLLLVEKTCDWLGQSQNEDGGFGPWRNHPIGSDPWSTGVCLIGLSAWPTVVKHDVLLHALDWLGRCQLPNGLWPCHYLEEGSAYCLWGAVEALKVLKKAGHPCAA